MELAWRLHGACMVLAWVLCGACISVIVCVFCSFEVWCLANFITCKCWTLQLLQFMTVIYSKFYNSHAFLVRNIVVQKCFSSQES